MKRLLLKASLASALLGLTAGTALAQSSLTTIRHATALRAGETVIGTLAQTQPMHVVITLKLRNQAQLDAFLANPAHAILTPAEFTAHYSPTVGQAQSVASFLKHAGFTNVSIASNRLLVSGDAPAGITAGAFHTSFVQVLTPHGRHAFANSSDVRIPAALQSTVLSVLGMQNVHEAHTFIQYAHTNAVHTNATGSAVGHNPTDFPVIYGASSMAAASSVPVGIITEGSMSNVESDLQQFTSSNSLPTVNVQVVGSGSSDTSGDDEWDLDSQDIVAMGGVQNLVLYDAASLSDSDLTTDYNAVVSANAVKVINVSLGECETDAQSSGAASSDDQIFQQADAQGQTFSVSAGDSGADECGTGGTTPSYPASSPYVVAVGGTELYTSGNTTWASETVWNNLSENEGATGGSPSTFEAQPSWQNGVGPNASSQYRGVADIAFDASPDSGALVIVDGQANQQIGGTSLASPLFVGSWARILQAKGTGIGFAAPLIYSAASANYAADFHDITSGNNNGESALTGWDYPTGFGSLIVSQLVNNIGGSGGGVAPPTASNGSVSTSENTAVSGTLSASGPSGVTLTFAIVSQPSHGTVTLTNASTGAFTYTPNSGYTGSDSFTFDASDSGGTSNTATESVTVNPVTTGCPAGYTEYAGSVANGSDDYQPNENYYYAPQGYEKGTLSTAGGNNFDLYLYEWNSYYGWIVVAQSLGNGNTQSISYNGGAGYYIWDIYANVGGGNYSFCLSAP